MSQSKDTRTPYERESDAFWANEGRAWDFGPEDPEYPCQKCGEVEASLATLDVCARCYVAIVAHDARERGVQLRLPLGDGVPLFEQVANAVLDVQALAFRRGGLSEVHNRIDEMVAARHRHELDGLDPHELDR